MSKPKKSKPYFDLSTPPSPKFSSRTYDNPQKSNGSLSLSAWLSYKEPILEYSNPPNLDSKVLDYADALIRARDLAHSAGIRCSSTPLASSVMKGVKVLARLDRDGLYYLGEVKEQVSKVIMTYMQSELPCLTPGRSSIFNGKENSDTSRSLQKLDFLF